MNSGTNIVLVEDHFSKASSTDFSSATSIMTTPAKYVPPALRNLQSLPSASNEESTAPRPWLSNRQQHMRTPPKSKTKVASHPSSLRTVSPDTSTGTLSPTRSDSSASSLDSVDIWRGRRKGGNRAPRIEPEGTKTWRLSDGEPLKTPSTATSSLSLKDSLPNVPTEESKSTALITEHHTQGEDVVYDLIDEDRPSSCYFSALLTWLNNV